MKLIPLLVPEKWLPLIDKARGDIPRNVWVREAIRDLLIELEVWPKTEEPVYITLEQKIMALWKRKGMEVIEEKVKPIGSGKFEWKIIAVKSRR